MTDAPPALAIPFDVGRFDASPLSIGRLTLRPLRASDSADVYAYQSIADVLRFIPWPMRTVEEGAEHTAKRAGMRVLEHEGDSIFFAIELVGEPALAGAGDRVIGDVMLRLSAPDSAGLEIGWVLHPDFAARGYATEAAGAVLGVAFGPLGAHRVHANLDARNTASSALCRRLGMRHEASFIADDYFKCEWTDTEVWSILRREWAAPAAPAR